MMNPTNANLFEKTLSSDMVELHFCTSLRESIFMLIISNTAINRRVTEEEFSKLQEEAEKFTCANTIIMETPSTKKDFHFNGRAHNVRKNLSDLYCALSEAEAFYLESCHTDSYNTGFTWFVNGNQYKLLCNYHEEITTED